MQTKHLHAFKQKIFSFDDDLQLLEVLRLSVREGDLTDKAGEYVLKRVDPAIHTHLARRKNSDVSRKQVIDHLCYTMYSAYVKEVYEEVTSYLRKILEMATLIGFKSDRLVGEHKTKIDVNEILKLGSWENVCRELSSSVFQSLEGERSTLNLLKKMRGKLDLSIDNELIDDVLPYLEARHFLVHTDGVVSEDFYQANKGLKGFGRKIKPDYTFASDMRSKVFALVEAYDAEIISKGLVPNEYMQTAKRGDSDDGTSE